MELKDKVILVTGGTSGVGKAIAQGLARLGAKTVIISRSHERGRQAVQEIAAATGNDQGEYLTADLSLQSSIRNVSDTFKQKYDRLHVLVNAGGAVYFDRQRTSEGIDRMFAVNVLSHFVLTNQLVDMLTASGPARVITVAGNPRFLKNAAIDVNDVQLDSHYSSMRASTQTILARTLLTFELARRLQGTGVTASAFHPGWVKSNLAQNAPWYVRAFGPLMNAYAKADCEIGVYLAAAKEVEGVSGVLFDDRKRIVPIHEAYDAGLKSGLWRACEKLVTE